MKLYIANTFALVPEIKELVKFLESKGFEITTKWWEHGVLKGRHKDLTPNEFFHEPDTAINFTRDYDGIKEADALLFYCSDTPRHYDGGNVEVGMAIAWHKPIFHIGWIKNTVMYYPIIRCDSIQGFLKSVGFLRMVK